MDINQKNTFGANIVNVNNALQDRILDEESKVTILSVLNERETTILEINYNSGDGESSRYADQIKSFVEASGFKIKSIQHLTVIRGNNGLTLSGQGIQRSPKDDSIVQLYIGYRAAR
jgi:hypothetical protein